jgi:hypothetical protein
VHTEFSAASIALVVQNGILQKTGTVVWDDDVTEEHLPSLQAITSA